MLERVVRRKSAPGRLQTSPAEDRTLAEAFFGRYFNPPKRTFLAIE